MCVPVAGPGERRLRNRRQKGVTGKDMGFMTRFENHFEHINREMRHPLVSSVPLIREMGEYSLLSEGKRLRPLLFVLTSHLCGYQGEDIYRISTVFEYVHTASLIHDDVLDDADVRRKKPSAKQVWGNLAAVLGGDFFYSKAAAIAIETGRHQLLELTNEATLRMIEGQALEMMHAYNWHLDKEQYMEIIRAKTAELMSAACASGAIMAGADAQRIDQLGHFGLNLGIAFQLMDDILDYTSSEETFGKPVGKDLKEGKITLPLIYSLADLEPQEFKKLQDQFKNRNPNSEELERLISRVRKSGAVERIMAEAKEFANRAQGYLYGFPDSPAKDDLAALNAYLVERDH